jgi:hypothetical protein
MEDLRVVGVGICRPVLQSQFGSRFRPRMLIENNLTAPDPSLRKT